MDRILNNTIYIPAQEVLPAPPPTPLGPHTDTVEDPATEEPPKEERRQPEGVQAETTSEAAAAVASVTEEEGDGSPESGTGSGLRHRRTQVDSELKSKEKETSVFPTNSSSKYSFVALEQRKEDLLRKAKRNYLLKRQETSQS